MTGYATGHPMNLLLAIDVYAALSEELGLPLHFPAPARPTRSSTRPPAPNSW